MRRGIKRRRSVASIITILLVAVSGIALGIGAASFLSKMLNVTNTSLGQLVSPAFGGRKLIRVLVLGEDETARNRKNGRGLSDTILIAAVDLDKKSVRAISIPRDSRIDIPGHGMQKINSAFTFGGPELTRQMAEQLLGVQIDYYVKTNIGGLKNIVDAVGGVGIDVEKDMFYTDRRGGLYIRLKKGYRHLDGERALQYVRFRHDRLGDISRIERQQKFLRAVARQMLAVRNLPKLPGIITQIYENKWVETNMSAKDLKSLAEITRDVRPDQMQMGMVPGVPENIGGISYWIVDQEKMREEVAKLLYFSDPTGKQVKVEVLNGSGISGVAQDVADKLRQEGYTVTGTRNAGNFDYNSSQIIVRKGALDGIQKMTRVLNCTNVSEENGSNTTSVDVTVIVGKDYRN